MKTPYPSARTGDVVDDYHGTKVADPYRWMEDLSDPDIEPWLAGQASITERVLSGVACRDELRARIEELSRIGGEGSPIARGGRWFRFRSSGDLRQPSLWMMDDPGGAGARCVFDPPDGVIVADVQPSPDGRRLLWAQTDGGSDWRTWRVMDVDTGRVHDDAAGDAKLWACWMPDCDSFLYTAFDAAGDDPRRATVRPQLRLHRVGTPVADDETVLSADSYFIATVDGGFLVVTYLYAPGYRLAYSPLGSSAFETVAETDAQLWFLGARGRTFYVATTHDAPYGRIVAIDLDRPDGWRTVVPEAEHPLPPIARSTLAGEHVVAVREHLGRSAITVGRLDGTDAYEMELPGVCRVVAQSVSSPASVSPDGGTVFFAVTSPSSPGTVLRHDLATRRTEILSEPSGTPSLVVHAEVVWARSADGTRVPMTIVRDASRVGEPDPPVVMEGYGGGGDSMEPYDFSPWKVAWLERGGAVASAHIRGGGELGADWQAAAARGGKLLAMEDFIGCASHLAGTLTRRIAITGRSSGGMLAAAAVVARPDLFRACVPEVGMFDPLRYHLFGMGRLMIPEYGCSDDPDDFAAMYAYSPLHNVRDGVAYPPFLLTVHTDDDRVAPGTAYKFLARMQAAQAGNAPVLMRVRTGAGHHAGDAPGTIAERADVLAFLASVLGVC